MRNKQNSLFFALSIYVYVSDFSYRKLAVITSDSFIKIASKIQSLFTSHLIFIFETCQTQLSFGIGPGDPNA